MKHADSNLRPCSRRRFLAASATAFIAGCADLSTSPFGSSQSTRLSARPSLPTKSVTPGRQPLGLDWSRDGFLYIPPAYDASVPAPLLVLLHGAGGSSAVWSDSFLSIVDDLGIVVLGVDSRGGTWDLFGSGFGPDVHFIDAALAKTFARVNVDARRLAIGGFSDGASYALSVGLMNGDLFRDVIAFSPGTVEGTSPRGEPRIFITHGTLDTVINVGTSRNIIVPDLKSRGYDVTYIEFEGPHAVVRSLARQAFERVAAI